MTDFMPDPYLEAWSDSPARAADCFGYSLKTAVVETEDRSDGQGRVLYRVWPIGPWPQPAPEQLS